MTPVQRHWYQRTPCSDLIRVPFCVALSATTCRTRLADAFRDLRTQLLARKTVVSVLLVAPVGRGSGGSYVALIWRCVCLR